jgi:hypothetical protein
MPCRKHALAVVLALAAAILLACSPEASRTRSGGPGADVGNRGDTVIVRERVPDQIFYRTPRVGQGVQVQR